MKRVLAAPMARRIWTHQYSAVARAFSSHGRFFHQAAYSSLGRSTIPLQNHQQQSPICATQNRCSAAANFKERCFSSSEPPISSSSSGNLNSNNNDEDDFERVDWDHDNNGLDGLEIKNHYSDDSSNRIRTTYLSGPNPGLASVISQGMSALERSAADIEYRTKNSSSLKRPHKKGSFRAGTLEPRQLAEGQRLLDVATDCLEELVVQAERGGLTVGQQKGLMLSGEPIVLLECVVNRTIKQAKLYWTLPYGLLLDERMQAKLYHQLTAKVQEQLMEGGGVKLLSRQVHNRLSSYYPPRIKMLPATDEMVAKALRESMQ